MKTLVAKQLLGNERKWYVVDANGKNLGRLATGVARLISGRDRVDFTPHIDNGANVIVINAEKIAVTGTKESVKMYRSHSQYMGGLKETVFSKMRTKNPTHILRHAIEGMLPKNRLKSDMSIRLKLVVGTEHEFAAQKPETITL
ncbi:MAG: 50S ribosomal protein L13 [Candidatus Gracilibacteria bacterium]|nr:50S ribosomal protein L13 [Candidatus Gracilibacteria bacterium]